MMKATQYFWENINNGNQSPPTSIYNLLQVNFHIHDLCRMCQGRGAQPIITLARSWFHPARVSLTAWWISSTIPSCPGLDSQDSQGFFFVDRLVPRNVWSLLGRIADGIITIVILVYLYVYLKFYATWLRQNLCDEPTFRQLATCRGSTQRTWAPAGSVRHLGTCPKSLNHVRNQSKRWFPEIGVPCIDGFYIINHKNPQSSIQIIQSARES